jgi:asparagine synthase (glutamine-hydrolysing)
MCRIAGIFAPNLAPETLQHEVIAMRDAMHRGGPDGVGQWTNAERGLSFGHRRLALLDLSEAGHQPMQSFDKNVVICFNGEIYNFREIRQELINKGLTFRTQTDTEVILAAYQMYGTKCFAMFNGMFAFALADLQKQKLYLVRDGEGIKPLYYALLHGKLIFASEIRAFKALKIEKFTEQPIWKHLFLTFGHLPEPFTTLSEVKILPKGTFITFALDNFSPKQNSSNTATNISPIAHETFDKPLFTNQITDYKTAVKLVRQTLIESVERHLFADAPVGMFMSGGIDSSLIALIADKILQRENNYTLSVVFKEPKYSEKKYQEIVASKLRNQHQYFEVSKQDFYESFADIKSAADQPSIDGINTYFISKFAKQAGLKAVLSGVGADELFGGYSTFQRAKYLPYLKILPNFTFKLVATLSKDKYKKIGFLALPDSLGNYLFFRSLFTPDMVSKVLDCTENEVYQALEKVFLGNQINTLSLGNQVSWQEYNLYMQNQLLKDSDVMSMWHSLELRTPFLDKEFVKLAHNIDAETKFYSTNRTKELLLAAFDDILPQEVWNRPKQGFTFPFQEWLLQHQALLNTGKEQNKTITTLLDSFRQGTLHWSRVWAILQVI